MRENIEKKKIVMLVQHLPRVSYVLLCVLVVLFLSACGNGEFSNEDSSAEESIEEYVEDYEEDYVDHFEVGRELSDAPHMTREYVIEHGILTEEDLYGVDFEAIAELYSWVEGIEDDWNIKYIVMSMKNDYLLPGYGFFDYSWLVVDTEPEVAFTEEDIDKITTISLNYQSGNYYECMIFDLVESKAYLGQNIRLYKIGVEPSVEISLTEDQVEEIKLIMRNSAVDEWDKRYEGTSEGTTGSFWFHLYYALEDGRIYSHSGNGVLGGAPNKYSILENGLEAFWK